MANNSISAVPSASKFKVTEQQAEEANLRMQCYIQAQKKLSLKSGAPDEPITYGDSHALFHALEADARIVGEFLRGGAL